MTKKEQALWVRSLTSELETLLTLRISWHKVLKNLKWLESSTLKLISVRNPTTMVNWELKLKNKI
jgi:hypothetical protein